MSDAEDPDKAKAKAALAREERLAKALRDNLRRRKQQARARKTDKKGAPDAL